MSATGTIPDALTTAASSPPFRLIVQRRIVLTPGRFVRGLYVAAQGEKKPAGRPVPFPGI
jgi:hypothetical protein